MLTACVKPFTYFNRTTSERGIPEPVLERRVFMPFASLKVDAACLQPTRAAVRADRKALARFAPKRRKLALATVDEDITFRFFKIGSFDRSASRDGETRTDTRESICLICNKIKRKVSTRNTNLQTNVWKRYVR
jgi:hypothetical protein